MAGNGDNRKKDKDELFMGTANVMMILLPVSSRVDGDFYKEERAVTIPASLLPLQT